MTGRRKGCLIMAGTALLGFCLPQSVLSGCFSLPVQRLLRSVTGHVPFSVSESMILLAAAFAVYTLLKAFAAALALKRLKPLFRYIGGIGTFLVFLAASYVLIWLPIARTESPVSSKDISGQLPDLASDLIHQAERLKGDDPRTRDEIRDEAERLLLSETGSRAFIKFTRHPEIMKRLRLSGICFPWSAEALIREDLRKTSLPFVAAHEGAHQLGFGSEAEANYIAYRACMRGSRAARYSGTVYMLYYVLDRLGSVSPKAEILAKESMSVRVRSDVERIARSQGSVSSPASQITEAFLHLTGQRGREDYGRAVEYLING